jgi:hypothetical protein
MEGSGLNSTGSRQGHMAGSFEHGKKPPTFIKRAGDILSNYTAVNFSRRDMLHGVRYKVPTAIRCFVKQREERSSLIGMHCLSAYRAFQLLNYLLDFGEIFYKISASPLTEEM